LVEVVRFFVTYGLARNKTGSVKDGITELYPKKNNVSYSAPLFFRGLYLQFYKNFEVFISRIA
jgi:hypothetical protein